MRRSDVEHFERMVSLLPSDPPPRTICEYVEGRRILPPSTPFPGHWQMARTEYFRELLEGMSPYSPIQHEVVMSAAQIGKTSALECVAAYYVDAVPAEQLFVSATSDLCDRWATKRFPPLVQSLGFAHKLVSTSSTSQSRRSGDRVFKKTYIGGALDLVSAQSASSLRAESKRILLRDEIDGCPSDLTRTGEGSWLEVSEARTIAWANRRKILDISTPTVYGSSEIARLFELGDQRIYKVPCPLCGAVQELVIGSQESQTGLRGEFKDGRLVRAFYQCGACHEAIYNHQKAAMVAKGKWEPTAISQSPYLRSRRISALYSPFVTWTEVLRKYLAAQGDPESERAFTNLFLGLPYRESGERPKMQSVVSLRSNYREGVVQTETIYLVAGADVQRGSDRDPSTGELRDPDNPPRIEMEVMGIGKGYRTASVAYLRFEGPIDDPYAGAWEKLGQWAATGGRDGGPGAVFFRADGRPFQIVQLLIDSGDGPYTAAVYEACRQLPNTSPSKGFQFLKDDRKRAERGDQAGTQFFRKWKASKLDSGQLLYTVSTNWYKVRLFNALRVQSTLENPNPPGLCKFPFDRSDEYFAQLTGEEKRSDGSFHALRRRVEALDCRVLCMAAGDIALDRWVAWYRTELQRKGAGIVAVQSIDSTWVLDKLAAEMSPWPGTP